MAYATNQERKSLRESGTCDFTVQIVTGAGVEIEVAADDTDHASNIVEQWVGRMNAKSAEIFRVLHDGSLNPILGATTRETWDDWHGPT